jgi:hypothetical protein
VRLEHCPCAYPHHLVAGGDPLRTNHVILVLGRYSVCILDALEWGMRVGLGLGAVGFVALVACGGQGGQSEGPPIVPLQPAGAAPILWTLGDMVRAGPTAPPANHSREFRLEAARDEIVSFQLVVTAPIGGLTGLRLRASSFRNGSGAKTSTISTALYREHFSKVTKASPVHGHPKSLGPGIYPDGLIPFIDDATGKPPKPSRIRAEPIDIVGGRTQPYWLDVATSKDTPPGDYTSTIVVSSNQGGATARVLLHVWHFSMPRAPTVDSDFQLEGSADDNTATQAEVLRNRVQVQPVDTAEERELAARFGLKMVGLGFWSGASYGHCKMSGPPPVAAIERVAGRQALQYLYDQTADEVGACNNLRSVLVPIIKDWAKNLHAAGVLQLITMAPIAELRSDVNIWVMLAPEYERARGQVEKSIAHGDRAWFYTTLSQDDYSPKWELDVPPGDFPIVALIDGNLNLSGELYWALNAYQYVKGHDPWNDIESNQGGELYAGEGILMYPARDVGTKGQQPSMRLKWIRDGMYEADEASLLERCGLGEWAHAQTKTIAEDFHRWTYDPDAVERVRERLAQRLDSDCAN